MAEKSSVLNQIICCVCDQARYFFLSLMARVGSVPGDDLNVSHFLYLEKKEEANLKIYGASQKPGNVKTVII